MTTPDACPCCKAPCPCERLQRLLGGDLALAALLLGRVADAHEAFLREMSPDSLCRLTAVVREARLRAEALAPADRPRPRHP